MVDVVDRQTRSRMMSGIRGTNTKPELMVRKSLHSRGFRYRLHAKDIPGKPDLVLPKYRTVIFVHGCFWHRHDCTLFRWPKTREAFWRDKLTKNTERDKRNVATLLSEGWRVLVIWECALKGADPSHQEATIDKAKQFIVGASDYQELSSRTNPLR